MTDQRGHTDRSGYPLFKTSAALLAQQMQRQRVTGLQTTLQSHSNQNTTGYGHKTRHIDQWNRIENPEINLCTYGQFMTEEARKYNEEKTVYSTSGSGKTRKPHVNKIRTAPHNRYKKKLKMI